MAYNTVGTAKFESLCRETTHCRRCFERGWVRPAFIDMAQPRYIGPGYWTAERRVAVMMLNPGQGNANAADQKARQLMSAFRDGAPLAPVLEQQRAAMPSWGRGKKYAPFIAALGLDLDSIATANTALCATADNKYPRAMLNECWTNHTAALLDALSPHVVVLCGSDTHKFASRFRVKAVLAPHYASRLSGADYAQRMAAVRREIEV